MGFSLLSDFLPFRPFLTQISPPSYSHYLYIFFDVLNPSFSWSSSLSSTSWFPSTSNIFRLLFVNIIIKSFLRQVHRLFQCEFSTECDLVLPLSISFTVSFFLRLTSSCLSLVCSSCSCSSCSCSSCSCSSCSRSSCSCSSCSCSSCSCSSCSCPSSSCSFLFLFFFYISFSLALNSVL